MHSADRIPEQPHDQTHQHRARVIQVIRLVLMYKHAPTHRISFDQGILHVQTQLRRAPVPDRQSKHIPDRNATTDRRITTTVHAGLILRQEVPTIILKESILRVVRQSPVISPVGYHQETVEGTVPFQQDDNH